MPLIINSDKLKGELNAHFRKNKRALSDVRLTKRVLSEACPIIEKRLGNPRYLKTWTWGGQQAFYNTEPGGQKELRGILSSGNVSGDHLANQFHVVPAVGAGGYGGFTITNDKVVYSKHGKWNLFDLLWHGFGPYKQPDPKKTFVRKSLDEINQMSWRQKRAWRTGTTTYLETPMTYYYRYAHKWYYRRLKRAGFNETLKGKFKLYVMGAVEYGIEKAIKNILKSGEGSAAMKKIWDELK